MALLLSSNKRDTYMTVFTFIFIHDMLETDLAQEAFNDASEKESKVQEGIRDIERKLNMDLGPDETFAQLVDNCFDFKDTE